MKLNHVGTKELQTARLTLRRMINEDAIPMFTNWASDPEVAKYLQWKSHENVEVTKVIISMWLENYKSDSNYHWGIVIKETNELIGTIGLVGSDEEIRMCEVGYCIGKLHWGKGYVKEALDEVLRFLFNEVGFNRVEAMHNTLNINSGKVMLKCGMKYEGRLRSGGINNKGEFIDYDLYSILKSEYL